MTDASSLGFGYRPTPWRWQAEWRDGSWSEGELLSEPTITLEEGSCALHYGQQCFEGLKAYPSAEGEPRLFRPDQNAARMARSAARLLMPELPEELFLRGVNACVHANRALLPKPGSGGTLYVRPLLIGVGDNLGLRPAPRYLFRVFCSPVGPYFKDGLSGIRLVVSDQDRVAPRGTGSYKVGGNYAGGLLLHKQAKEAGFDELLYLDAYERKWIDEAGSANVFGILPTEPPTFVTPESAAILPSITMKSLLTVAADEGLTVERRKVHVDEIGSFREMGLTGTATVITPVESVTRDGVETTLPGGAPGPITRQIYTALTELQHGRRADPRGWSVSVVDPAAQTV